MVIGGDFPILDIQPDYFGIPMVLRATASALFPLLLLTGLPAGAADPADDVITRCAAAAGDPAPGTPEFVLRDLQNIYCTEQRRIDYFQHPVNAGEGPELYGGDPYREPSRLDGVRFRYRALDVPGAESEFNPNSATNAELYLPCGAGDCPDLADGLQTHQPPYPVAVILHGFLSDKNHMWWISQPLAEQGYAVLAVNGVGDHIPGAALDWLFSADNPIAAELDLARIGIAGHSLGAENSTRTQGDPRVAAIIGYDNCDSTDGCSNSSGSRLHDYPDEQLTVPTLFITADYDGFPGYAVPRDKVPGTLRLVGFERLRSVGVDTMLITPRATTHLDWAGSFTFGNRLNELVSGYFSLAWFDRYLKGRLVVDRRGNVVTTQGRNPAQERTHRQAIAEAAFARLTAERFDDSADLHNISQGYWDLQQAALRGDPVRGGNIPYAIADMPVADRLSFYHRSVCFLTLTDVVAGRSAQVIARADSGLDGDMRRDGCTPRR